MKKNNTFKLLSLSLIFGVSSLCSCNVANNIYVEGDFTYTLLDDQTYSVRYTGNEKNVILKDSVNGHTVTKIDSKAFLNNNTIESIVIPDSIIEIGSNAFSNCSSLQTVNLHQNIKLDSNVFYNSNNIKFNESENGFYLGVENNDYYYLVKTKYDSSSETFNVNDNTKVIYEAFINSEYKYINIPNGIEEISAYSFNNSNIESITLPESIHSLKSTFTNCKNLTQINLPSTLEKMERDSIYNCNNLKKIIIPNSVKFIGSRSITENNSLEEIEFEYHGNWNYMDNKNYKYNIGKPETIKLNDSKKNVEYFQNTYSFCVFYRN